MQSTVIMRSVDRPVEAAKDGDPRVHVDGGHIVNSQIVGALLRYGTADRYCFLADSSHVVERARQTLALYPGAERAEVIPTDLLGRVTDERAVMQVNNIHMFGLSYLRRVAGRRRWPVLGLQDYPAFALVALATLFEELQPYDCLICTSQAGREAFAKTKASVSESLRQRFGLALPEVHRYAVIPLGVDVGSFETVDRHDARTQVTIADDAFVFLYLGRFSPQSKMDLFPLVLAFSQVVGERRRREQDLPWLLLAGDDCEMNLGPHLERFAAELGVADRVRIIPNPSRALKGSCYGAADAFVSPSDNVQETFGVTIIEAMAAGLPVIASDWSGYRDSVETGVTGLLVPTYWNAGIDYVSRFAMVRGDGATHWMLGQSVTVDPQRLRDAMHTLMDQPELRQSMGAEAKRRAAARYDWSVVIGQYEELWKDLSDEAAAVGAESEPFRYSASSYDYVKTFGHYATKLIPLDAGIQVTALGRDFSEGRQPLLPLDMDVGLFTGGATRHIAGLVAANGTRAWGAVADEAASSLHAPVELMRHHVARLLKYGLVELVPTQSL
jgi:glycosyltransferase involved in cell wall biosynthesis